MGINLSQGPSTKYYSSDRITQLIGNGLMTFIDKKTMAFCISFWRFALDRLYMRPFFERSGK